MGLLDPITDPLLNGCPAGWTMMPAPEQIMLFGILHGGSHACDLTKAHALPHACMCGAIALFEL